MTAQLASSREFASLVEQLQQAPNNVSLQQLVIKNLPAIRELAKTDPLAMYHWAHMFAPNSPQYKQTMLKSADLGCTNAMLAVCQLLIKSANPQDKKIVADYKQKIEQSEDSYIRKHAQELFGESPQNKVGKNRHGLFAQQRATSNTPGSRETYQP